VASAWSGRAAVSRPRSLWPGETRRTVVASMSGLARILVEEMPCSRRALREGRIGEWKARILVRETAWRPGPVHPAARPDLPHPLVRGPDPAQRPRRIRRR